MSEWTQINFFFHKLLTTAEVYRKIPSCRPLVHFVQIHPDKFTFAVNMNLMSSGNIKHEFSEH